MRSIGQIGTCALMLAAIGTSVAFAQDGGDASSAVTTLSGTTMTPAISTDNPVTTTDDAEVAQLKMALARAHERLNRFSKTVTCLHNNMYIWAADGSSTQPTVTTAWATCDISALNVGGPLSQSNAVNTDAQTPALIAVPAADQESLPTVATPVYPSYCLNCPVATRGASDGASYAIGSPLPVHHYGMTSSGD